MSLRNTAFSIMVVAAVIILPACKDQIPTENKILILAKRSVQPGASKGSLHSMKYVWAGKLYGDIHPFDARFSKQSDYFLIYIDKKKPGDWVPYSRKTYGYSDTVFIPDSLKRELRIDKNDFLKLKAIK